MRLYTLLERENILLSMSDNDLRVKLMNIWLEKKEIDYDGYNFLAKHIHNQINKELIDG